MTSLLNYCRHRPINDHNFRQIWRKKTKHKQRNHLRVELSCRNSRPVEIQNLSFRWLQCQFLCFFVCVCVCVFLLKVLFCFGFFLRGPMGYLLLRVPLRCWWEVTALLLTRCSNHLLLAGRKLKVNSGANLPHGKEGGHTNRLVCLRFCSSSALVKVLLSVDKGGAGLTFDLVILLFNFFFLLHLINQRFVTFD